MPQVSIIELMPRRGHGGTASPLGGEHVWVEIEFSTGSTVTVRVDEHGFSPHQPKVYLALNDEVGQDVTLTSTTGLDPHGTPWRILSDRELQERQSWCMRPVDHERLDDELDRRNGIEHTLRTFIVATPLGNREWEATSRSHAREQHEDAFGDEGDERIYSIRVKG